MYVGMCLARLICLYGCTQDQGGMVCVCGSVNTSFPVNCLPSNTHFCYYLTDLTAWELHRHVHTHTHTHTHTHAGSAHTHIHTHTNTHTHTLKSEQMYCMLTGLDTPTTQTHTSKTHALYHKHTLYVSRAHIHTHTHTHTHSANIIMTTVAL